ncbi:MAG: hypothetical protein AAFV43_11770 [Planctomycetota bacterium]
MLELCEAFGHTAERRQILSSFLSMRHVLQTTVTDGFQWIDGSFVENVEAAQGRPPGDIDVVTFADPSTCDGGRKGFMRQCKALLDPTQSKQIFRTHHFFVPLDIDGRSLVELSTYYFGLFSHKRDGTPKGMLVADLHDQGEDQAATEWLGKYDD